MSAPEASHSARTGLGCPVTGKARYPSEEEAQGILDRGSFRSIDGSGNVPVRTYLCPLCEGWHFTHHARRKAS